MIMSGGGRLHNTRNITILHMYEIHGLGDVRRSAKDPLENCERDGGGKIFENHL